ncbi:hypothetical protein [Pseudodesulfovibrio pelocollis]|uniref:hypothetical protein n=1 Tax=Pseudodesulfovibrio pelocollis TaxID=3051432 RepID=UPI00255A7675|nr:hypothetical protein [Pseudodesulfovibrio sp. SB368]
MRDSINQTAAARAAALQPFVGLGFDMTGVCSAARAMVLRRPGMDMDRQTPPMPSAVARPSGYTLLVTLCREIRGR